MTLQVRQVTLIKAVLWRTNSHRRSSSEAPQLQRLFTALRLTMKQPPPPLAHKGNEAKKGRVRANSCDVMFKFCLLCRDVVKVFQVFLSRLLCFSVSINPHLNNFKG